MWVVFVLLWIAGFALAGLLYFAHEFGKYVDDVCSKGEDLDD